MKVELRPVPSVEGLEISCDGELIYFNGKIKLHRIQARKDSKAFNKVISLGTKQYMVARLVYEAWVHPIKKHRNISYIDKNKLNTHYKNLLPRPLGESLEKPENFAEVPILENVIINNSGTEVYQDNLFRNITQIYHKEAKQKYSDICTLMTSRGAKHYFISHLIAYAFLKWDGKGYIVHKDANIRNNYYKNIDIISYENYKKLCSARIKAHRDLGVTIGKYSAIPKSEHQKIKKQLLKGVTLQSLSKKYGCSDMCIVRLKKKLLTPEEIKQLNIKNGVNTDRKTWVKGERLENVLTDLKSGLYQIDIAKKYDISPSVICRIAKQYNIKNSYKTARKVNDEVKQALKKDSINLNIIELAEKYNLSRQTVSKYLKD